MYHWFNEKQTIRSANELFKPPAFITFCMHGGYIANWTLGCLKSSDCTSQSSDFYGNFCINNLELGKFDFRAPSEHTTVYHCHFHNLPKLLVIIIYPKASLISKFNKIRLLISMDEWGTFNVQDSSWFEMLCKILIAFVKSVILWDQTKWPAKTQCFRLKLTSTLSALH